MVVVVLPNISVDDLNDSPPIVPVVLPNISVDHRSAIAGAVNKPDSINEQTKAIIFIAFSF